MAQSTVKVFIDELTNQLGITTVMRLEPLFQKMFELEKEKTLTFTMEYSDLVKYGYMRKTIGEYYDEFFNSEP